MHVSGVVFFIGGNLFKFRRGILQIINYTTENNSTLMNEGKGDGVRERLRSHPCAYVEDWCVYLHIAQCNAKRIKHSVTVPLKGGRYEWKAKGKLLMGPICYFCGRRRISVSRTSNTCGNPGKHLTEESLEMLGCLWVQLKAYFSLGLAIMKAWSKNAPYMLKKEFGL